MAESNPEIEHVIDSVMNGDNVFFTGAAGTGKSTLLRKLIKLLEVEKCVAITSFTNIAAGNINGISLHKFIGCGLFQNYTKEGLVKMILKRSTTHTRWLSTQVMIIDEISMLGASDFDKFESVARAVRDNDLPFGGIQMIVVGDFFQLPPIDQKLCFKAQSWSKIDVNVTLKTIYRQKNDLFKQVIGRLRENKTTPEDDLYILSLERPIFPGPGSVPTYTVCTNKEAKYINMDKINDLDFSTKRLFSAIDKKNCKGLGIIYIDSVCKLLNVIELRVGARVMLTMTLSTRLFNGSVGHVTGYAHGFPIVMFECGVEQVIGRTYWSLVRNRITQQERSYYGKPPQKDYATLLSREQIPLILAWAITIHKSQGQTLEWQIAKVDNIRSNGQMYTALSRISDPDKLQVIGYSRKGNKVSREVMDFYDENEEKYI